MNGGADGAELTEPNWNVENLLYLLSVNGAVSSAASPSGGVTEWQVSY